MSAAPCAKGADSGFLCVSVEAQRQAHELYHSHETLGEKVRRDRSIDRESR